MDEDLISFETVLVTKADRQRANREWQAKYLPFGKLLHEVKQRPTADMSEGMTDKLINPSSSKTGRQLVLPTKKSRKPINKDTKLRGTGQLLRFDDDIAKPDLAPMQTTSEQTMSEGQSADIFMDIERPRRSKMSKTYKKRVAPPPNADWNDLDSVPSDELDEHGNLILIEDVEPENSYYPSAYTTELKGKMHLPTAPYDSQELAFANDLSLVACKENQVIDKESAVQRWVQEVSQSGKTLADGNTRCAKTADESRISPGTQAIEPYLQNRNSSEGAGKSEASSTELPGVQEIYTSTGIQAKSPELEDRTEIKTAPETEASRPLGLKAWVETMNGNKARNVYVTKAPSDTAKVQEVSTMHRGERNMTVLSENLPEKKEAINNSVACTNQSRILNGQNEGSLASEHSVMDDLIQFDQGPEEIIFSQSVKEASGGGTNEDKIADPNIGDARGITTPRISQLQLLRLHLGDSNMMKSKPSGSLQPVATTASTEIGTEVDTQPISLQESLTDKSLKSEGYLPEFGTIPQKYHGSTVQRLIPKNYHHDLSPSQTTDMYKTGIGHFSGEANRSSLKESLPSFIDPKAFSVYDKNFKKPQGDAPVAKAPKRQTAKSTAQELQLETDALIEF